jgi:hypothetical protein
MEIYDVKVIQMGGALGKRDKKQEIYFAPSLPLKTVSLGCKNGILINKGKYETELKYVRKGKKIRLAFERTKDNEFLKLINIGV